MEARVEADNHETCGANRKTKSSVNEVNRGGFMT